MILKNSFIRKAGFFAFIGKPTFMLTLRTALRNFVIISFSLIIFTCCSSNSKKDREIIRVLNETIVSSNQMIAASTKDFMASFEEKLRNPGSGERAKVWYPKAQKIEQLSDNVLGYIESIKNDLGSNLSFSSELFEKLVNYKNEILMIDPKINHEFQKSLRLFTIVIDSSATNQKKIFLNYFDNISTMSALAMLNKLQNNIRLIQNKVIMFCHENVGCVDCGIHYSFSAIAIQSSSVIEGGHQLEIIAGLGYLSITQKPEIFVYGRQVKIYDDGAAHYKIKAPLKSGKYYVPVKIKYIDQNGNQQTIQKEIEYTVANIQKQ